MTEDVATKPTARSPLEARIMEDFEHFVRVYLDEKKDFLLINRLYRLSHDVIRHAEAPFPVGEVTPPDISARAPSPDARNGQCDPATEDAAMCSGAPRSGQRESCGSLNDSNCCRRGSAGRSVAKRWRDEAVTFGNLVFMVGVYIAMDWVWAAIKLLWRIAHIAG